MYNGCLTNNIIRSMKKCFKCGECQPRENFYKHSKMADGLLGKCKRCTKKDVSEHRLKNIERIRKYDRDRAKHPERAKSAAAVKKAWMSQDKRILRCHNAVRRAISKGVIKRLPCVVCGRIDSYAHHESYDRPLDVVFYCQPHHKERHKQMVLQDIDPFNNN